MWFKTLSIVALSALLLQTGYAAEMRSAAMRMSWFVPLQSLTAGSERTGSAQADQWAAENLSGKGVLERRFRLRSRLNTHLLMKKFQQ